MNFFLLASLAGSPGKMICRGEVKIFFRLASLAGKNDMCGGGGKLFFSARFASGDNLESRGRTLNLGENLENHFLFFLRRKNPGFAIFADKK